MTNKDAKFFNCSEEHELDYVSGKYKEKGKVKEFIKEKCKDKTIHYWTQEKLAAYLAENGFEVKKTLSQSELLNAIAEKVGSKAQAQTVLAAVLESLSEAMKTGDSIVIKGFGTFKVTERPARVGRNPRTGEAMNIEASKTVKFTPAKALKDALGNVCKL